MHQQNPSPAPPVEPSPPVVDFLTAAIFRAASPEVAAQRAAGILRANCREKWDVLMDPPVYWRHMAEELAGVDVAILAIAVHVALAVDWAGGIPGVHAMLWLCRNIAAGEDPATAAAAAAEESHRSLARHEEACRREQEMIDRLGWDGYIAWLDGDRQQLPLPLPLPGGATA